MCDRRRSLRRRADGPFVHVCLFQPPCISRVPSTRFTGAPKKNERRVRRHAYGDAETGLLQSVRVACSSCACAASCHDQRVPPTRHRLQLDHDERPVSALDSHGQRAAQNPSEYWSVNAFSNALAHGRVGRRRQAGNSCDTCTPVQTCSPRLWNSSCCS
jgi:hypothetical protein